MDRHVLLDTDGHAPQPADPVGRDAGIRHVTVDRFNSQQAAKRPWTEKDISKFHWVNTRTPSREESPEYQELAANDFADFRLEVGGMVSEPASFSLEELKAIASQSQITMHTCMQGWTGIAKWTGIVYGTFSSMLVRSIPRPDG